MQRLKQKNLRLNQIGEFRLLDLLFAKDSLSSKGLGIGDDCAFIPKNTYDFYAITVDACIENVHFKRDQNPALVGRKALAANVSDLAAKGARPEFALISWELPKDLPLVWVKKFLRGFQAAAKESGLKVIGGNTSSAKKISVHVTLLGTRSRSDVKLRSHARAGQIVCVTGTLGDAAAGLDAQFSGRDPSLAKLHFMRPSRVAIGARINRDPGVGATMDISDGLLSDLDKLLRASNCRAKLQVAEIPLSKRCMRYAQRADRALSWALHGGEDYELLFTVDSNRLAPLQRAFPHQITAIGEVIPHKSEVFRQPSKVIHARSRLIPDETQVIPWGKRILLAGPRRLLSALKLGAAGFDHFG